MLYEVKHNTKKGNLNQNAKKRNQKVARSIEIKISIVNQWKALRPEFYLVKLGVDSFLQSNTCEAVLLGIGLEVEIKKQKKCQI